MDALSEYSLSIIKESFENYKIENKDKNPITTLDDFIQKGHHTIDNLTSSEDEINNDLDRTKIQLNEKKNISDDEIIDKLNFNSDYSSYENEVLIDLDLSGSSIESEIGIKFPDIFSVPSLFKGSLYKIINGPRFSLFAETFSLENKNEKFIKAAEKKELIKSLKSRKKKFLVFIPIPDDFQRLDFENEVDPRWFISKEYSERYDFKKELQKQSKTYFSSVGFKRTLIIPTLQRDQNIKIQLITDENDKVISMHVIFFDSWQFYIDLKNKNSITKANNGTIYSIIYEEKLSLEENEPGIINEINKDIPQRINFDLSDDDDDSNEEINAPLRFLKKSTYDTLKNPQFFYYLNWIEEEWINSAPAKDLKKFINKEELTIFIPLELDIFEREFNSLKLSPFNLIIKKKIDLLKEIPSTETLGKEYAIYSPQPGSEFIHLRRKRNQPRTIELRAYTGLNREMVFNIEVLSIKKNMFETNKANIYTVVYIEEREKQTIELSDSDNSSDIDEVVIESPLDDNHEIIIDQNSSSSDSEVKAPVFSQEKIKSIHLKNDIKHISFGLSSDSDSDYRSDNDVNTIGISLFKNSTYSVFNNFQNNSLFNYSAWIYDYLGIGTEKFVNSKKLTFFVPMPWISQVSGRKPIEYYKSFGLKPSDFIVPEKIDLTKKKSYDKETFKTYSCEFDEHKATIIINRKTLGKNYEIIIQYKKNIALVFRLQYPIDQKKIFETANANIYLVEFIGEIEKEEVIYHVFPDVNEDEDVVPYYTLEKNVNGKQKKKKSTSWLESYIEKENQVQENYEKDLIRSSSKEELIKSIISSINEYSTLNPLIETNYFESIKTDFTTSNYGIQYLLLSLKNNNNDSKKKIFSLMKNIMNNYLPTTFRSSKFNKLFIKNSESIIKRFINNFDIDMNSNDNYLKNKKINNDLKSLNKISKKANLIRNINNNLSQLIKITKTESNFDSLSKEFINEIDDINSINNIYLIEISSIYLNQLFQTTSMEPNSELTIFMDDQVDGILGKINTNFKKFL